MKKWMIITVLLLALLAGGFLTMFKVIMPRSATMLVPAKWRNIPLGQNRTIVHKYLGQPLAGNVAEDNWENKLNNNKRYVLTVRYNADTIAGSYHIVYEVKLLGLTDITKVAADSFP